jgi:hypothetical protein
MSPKSVDTLAAEIEALRERSDDRMENINTRMVSFHDNIRILRGRAEENATNIQTIKTELQGIRDDIADARKDARDDYKALNKKVDETKQEFADWIDGLASKFKWTAAVLGPLVLGILGFIIK